MIGAYKITTLLEDNNTHIQNYIHTLNQTWYYMPKSILNYKKYDLLRKHVYETLHFFTHSKKVDISNHLKDLLKSNTFSFIRYSRQEYKSCYLIIWN